MDTAGTFTWTPTAAGVYSFGVTETDDETGEVSEQPVTVTVIDPNTGQDQTCEALSTALPVSLATNTTTTLTGSYAIGNGAYGALDVDLFGVALTAGQTLNAGVLANQIGLSNLTSYLRVFDANGNELANSSTNSDADAWLSFTVPADGTYYVGVSGTPNTSYDPNVPGSGMPGSTGAYQLQLQALS